MYSSVIAYEEMNVSGAVADEEAASGQLESAGREREARSRQRENEQSPSRPDAVAGGALLVEIRETEAVLRVRKRAIHLCS